MANIGTWACTMCTFMNDEFVSVCDMCGSARETEDAFTAALTAVHTQGQGADARDGAAASSDASGGGPELASLLSDMHAVKQTWNTEKQVYYKSIGPVATRLPRFGGRPEIAAWVATTFGPCLTTLTDQATLSALHAGIVKDTVLAATEYAAVAAEAGLMEAVDTVLQTCLKDTSRYFAGEDMRSGLPPVNQRKDVFIQVVRVAMSKVLPALQSYVDGIIQEPAPAEAAAAVPAADGPHPDSAASLETGDTAVGHERADAAALDAFIKPLACRQPFRQDGWPGLSVVAHALQALCAVCGGLKAAIAIQRGGSTHTEGAASEFAAALTQGTDLLVLLANAIAGLTEDVFRKDSSSGETLRQIFLHLPLAFDARDPFPHRFRLHAYAMALRSATFSRQLWAADALPDYVKQLKTESEHRAQRAREVTRKSAAVGEDAGQRAVLAEDVPPSPHMVAAWLLSPHVSLLDVLLREDAHEQLLRRADPLVALLAQQARLTEAHADGLLIPLLRGQVFATEERRTLVVTMTAESAQSAPHLVMHVYQRIREAAQSPRQYANAVQVAAALARNLQAQHKAAMKLCEDEYRTRALSARMHLPTDFLPVTEMESAFADLMLHLLLHCVAPTLGWVPPAASEEHVVDAQDTAEPVDAMDLAELSAVLDLTADDASVDSDHERAIDDIPSAASPPHASELPESSNPLSAAAADSMTLPAAPPTLLRATSSVLNQELGGVHVVQDPWLPFNDDDRLPDVHTALETLTSTFILFLSRSCDAERVHGCLHTLLHELAEIAVTRQLVAAGSSARGDAIPMLPWDATTASEPPFSVLMEYSTISPSHDRVPRILQLLRLLLQFMYTNCITLMPVDAADGGDGAPPAFRGVFVQRHTAQHYMPAIVHAVHDATGCVQLVLDELISYARVTPVSLLQRAALQKRFNVLYTLLRYSHLDISASIVQYLWAAVNQWPDADAVLSAHLALKELPVKPSDGAAWDAFLLSDAAAQQQLPAWLHAAALVKRHAAVRVMPSGPLHVAREIFWNFVRRVIGGAALDLVRAERTTTALASSVALAEDPEDLLLPSQRFTSSTQRYNVLSPWKRSHDGILMDPRDGSECLLPKDGFVELWEWLFDVSWDDALMPSTYQVRGRASSVEKLQRERDARAGVTLAPTPSPGGRMPLSPPRLHTSARAAASPAASPRALDRSLSSDGIPVPSYLSLLLECDVASVTSNLSLSPSSLPDLLGPTGLDAFVAARLIRHHVFQEQRRASHATLDDASSVVLVDDLRVDVAPADASTAAGGASTQETLPRVLVSLSLSPELAASSRHAAPLYTASAGFHFLCRIAFFGSSWVAKRAAVLLVDEAVAMYDRGVAAWLSRRSFDPTATLAPLSQHPLLRALKTVLRSRIDSVRPGSALRSTSRVHTSGTATALAALALTRCVGIMQTFVKATTAAAAALVRTARPEARASAAGVDAGGASDLPHFLVSHRARCGEAASEQAASLPAPTATPLVRGAQPAQTAVPPPLALDAPDAVTSSGAADVAAGRGRPPAVKFMNWTASARIEGTRATESTLLWSSQLKTMQPRSTTTLRDAETQRHLLLALCLTEDDYEVLFDVLASDVWNGSLLRDHAWQLLMELPTSPAVDGALTKPASVDWNALLSSSATESSTDAVQGATASATTPDASARLQSSSGDAWRALYGLQAVAARLRDGAASPAATTSTTWRADFIAANGLRMVLQQLLRAAPSKDWMRAQRLRGAAPTLHPSFDPKLSTDITAVCCRVLALTVKDLREKDFALRPTPGRPVKPEAGMRLLFQRVIQALWVAATDALASKRHRRTKAQAVQLEASDEACVAVCVNCILILRTIASREDLAEAFMRAVGTVEEPRPGVHPALWECWQRPDVLSQLVAVMVCRHEAVRRSALGFVRFVAKAHPEAASMVVVDAMQRASPLVAHGGEIAKLLVDVACADAAAATALTWIRHVLVSISQWWMSAARASTTSTAQSTRSLSEIDSSSATGTGAIVFDSAVSPAQWPLSSTKPMLVSLMGALQAVLRKFAERSLLLEPISVPLPEANSVRGADGVVTVRLTIQDRTYPLHQALYEQLCVLCLFGSAASLSTHSERVLSISQVHLLHDAVDRDAGFTLLRELLLPDGGVPADAMASMFRRIVMVSLAGASQDGQASVAPDASALAALFSSVDATFDPSEWQFSPADERKGETGYLGLENCGCTCYVNSVVQQLFMRPQLRQLIMSVTHPVPARLVDDKVRRVRARIVEDTDDSTTPKRSAPPGDASTGGASASTGAVTDQGDGSRSDANPSGASESKREADAPTAPATDRRTGGEGSSFDDLDEDGKRARLLLELQRAFVWLQQGRVKAYDPSNLVDACTVLSLPNSVLTQNDAAEFADKLIDAIDKRLRSAGAAAAAEQLQALMCGKTCSRKHRSCCNRVDTGENTPFTFLSVNVSKDTLAGCLRDTFKEDIMSGTNAVECPSCHIKATTRMQTCIASLPPVLTIHLKRFTCDYSDPQFRTVKVNSRVAFPMTLDMTPYTVRAQGATTPHGSDAAVDVYDLVGVLIHSGTAQSGHYYSYIRTRGSPSATSGASESQAQWCCFDDRNVSVFDPSRLATEAFGGVQQIRKTQIYYPYTEYVVEEPLTRNALLLFYERRAPSSTTSTSSATPDAAAASSLTALENTRRLVVAENERSARHAFAFDASLRTFLSGCMQDRLRTMLSSATLAGAASRHAALQRIGDMHELEQRSVTASVPSSDAARPELLFEVGARMYLSVIMRLREQGKDCTEFVDLLCEMMVAVPSCARWLLQLVSARPSPPSSTTGSSGATPTSASATWLARGLTHCTNAASRRHFMRLVRTAVEEVARHDASGSPVSLTLSWWPDWSGGTMGVISAGEMERQRSWLTDNVTAPPSRTHPLDADLATWLRVDARKQAEHAARTQHDAACSTLRTASQTEETLRSRARDAKLRLDGELAHQQRISSLHARLEGRLAIEQRASEEGVQPPPLSYSDELDFSFVDSKTSDAFDDVGAHRFGSVGMRSRTTVSRLQAAHREVTNVAAKVTVYQQDVSHLDMELRVAVDAKSRAAEHVEQCRVALEYAKEQRAMEVEQARSRPGPASSVTLCLLALTDLLAATGDAAIDGAVERCAQLLELLEAIAASGNMTLPSCLWPAEQCLHASDLNASVDPQDARSFSWWDRAPDFNRAMVEVAGAGPLLVLMGAPLYLLKAVQRMVDAYDNNLTIRVPPKVGPFIDTIPKLLANQGVYHAASTLDELLSPHNVELFWGYRITGYDNKAWRPYVCMLLWGFYHAAARTRRDLLTGRVLAFLVPLPATCKAAGEGSVHGAAVLVLRRLEDVTRDGGSFVVPSAQSLGLVPAGSGPDSAMRTHVLVPSTSAAAALANVAVLASVPRLTVTDLPEDVWLAGGMPIVSEFATHFVARMRSQGGMVTALLHLIFFCPKALRIALVRMLLLEYPTVHFATSEDGTSPAVMSSIAPIAPFLEDATVSAGIPVSGLLASLSPHGPARIQAIMASAAARTIYRDDFSKPDVNGVRGLLQPILLNYTQGPEGDVENRAAMQQMRRLWLPLAQKVITGSVSSVLSHHDVVKVFRNLGKDPAATLRAHPGAPRCLPSWNGDEISDEYHASACIESWALFESRATLLASIRHVAGLAADADAVRPSAVKPAAPSSAAADTSADAANKRVFRVVGAGMALCNGLYTDTGRLSCDAPVFEHGIGSMIVTLCRTQHGARFQWSILAAAGTSYRRHSHDYYRCDAPGAMLPPRAGWHLATSTDYCTYCRGSGLLHASAARVPRFGAKMPAPEVVLFAGTPLPDEPAPVASVPAPAVAAAAPAPAPARPVGANVPRARPTEPPVAPILGHSWKPAGIPAVNLIARPGEFDEFDAHRSHLPDRDDDDTAIDDVDDSSTEPELDSRNIAPRPALTSLPSPLTAAEQADLIAGLIAMGFPEADARRVAPLATDMEDAVQRIIETSS